MKNTKISSTATSILNALRKLHGIIEKKVRPYVIHNLNNWYVLYNLLLFIE